MSLFKKCIKSIQTLTNKGNYANELSILILNHGPTTHSELTSHN